MTDLYLKTLTEADMTAVLLEAGVIDDANISIDHIGPFTKVIGYDEEGEPIVEEYPDWHTNLRGSFDEDQLALLTPLSVVPPVPYRVWA